MEIFLSIYFGILPVCVLFSIYWAVVYREIIWDTMIGEYDNERFGVIVRILILAFYIVAFSGLFTVPYILS